MSNKERGPFFSLTLYEATHQKENAGQRSLYLHLVKRIDKYYGQRKVRDKLVTLEVRSKSLRFTRKYTLETNMKNHLYLSAKQRYSGGAVQPNFSSQQHVSGQHTRRSSVYNLGVHRIREWYQRRLCAWRIQIQQMKTRSLFSHSTILCTQILIQN